MKDIRRNIITVGIIISIIFLFVGSYLLYDVVMFSGRWIGNAHNPRLRDMRGHVMPGSIYDKNGVELAGSSFGHRAYPEDESLRLSTCHLVGDTYGFSPMGVEMTQGAWLLGFNESLYDRIKRLLLNDTAHGNDITLTIDSELCKFINKQLGSNSGTVVVLNYKTGDILAMVSTPSFDPAEINPHVANGGAAEKSLINRAIQAHYSPGQLFNIITASAAIEHVDLSDRDFYCMGTYKVDDKIIPCKKVHKEQTFEEVLLNQCECSVAKLGVNIGAKNLQKACNNIGFNYQFMFSDIVLYESYINLNSLTSKYDLAEASIGRHDTLTTPMHMAMIFGAIANGGKMNNIKLIKEIEGIDKSSRNKPNLRKSFSYEVARKLDEILEQNVLKGSVKNAKLLDDTVCGYSAEVKSKNEEEPQLSWFCGYLKSNEHPYAIATLIEDYEKDIDSLEKLSATILQKTTKKRSKYEYCKHIRRDKKKYSKSYSR